MDHLDNLFEGFTITKTFPEFVYCELPLYRELFDGYYERYLQEEPAIPFK